MIFLGIPSFFFDLIKQFYLNNILKMTDTFFIFKLRFKNNMFGVVLSKLKLKLTVIFLKIVRFSLKYIQSELSTCLIYIKNLLFLILDSPRLTQLRPD